MCTSAYLGNQQFTTSHLVFVNCNTALQIHWDWAWTMQDVVVESCRTGIVIVGGVSDMVIFFQFQSSCADVSSRLVADLVLGKVLAHLSWLTQSLPIPLQESLPLCTMRTRPRCFCKMSASIILKMPYWMTMSIRPSFLAAIR